MLVNVIGAGLAGCEAAWRLANSGYQVDLYEMKPVKYTPAHHYQGFAELVCSNSLRADGTANAYQNIPTTEDELQLYSCTVDFSMTLLDPDGTSGYGITPATIAYTQNKQDSNT